MSASSCTPHKERRDCCGSKLPRMTEMTEMGCAGREHTVEPVEEWKTFKTEKVGTERKI